jgi:hypothetical protein
MKKLIIKGVFSGSNSHHFRINVHRTNPNGYDFSKLFRENFNEIIIDLKPKTTYGIELNGFTFGKIDIELMGDINMPGLIAKSFIHENIHTNYIIETTD